MNKDIIKAAECCLSSESYCGECPFIDGGFCLPKFSNGVLDHHNKFRWHDLRKNPDDLPEYFRRVLIIMQDPVDGEIYEPVIAHYGMNSIFGNGPINTWAYSTYGRKVIAWKEIEPFEEESDD